jgi:ribosome-associated heat shock protein Hsp15
LSEAPARERLDKWLWAARFFKTRGLATAAVAGGKVKLDGVPVKPAREVKPGDELEIAVGEQRWTVVVRGLNEQRRPAPEARLLYEETPESLARRIEQMDLKRMAPAPGADLHGRPTKRAGRMIRRFSEG